MEYYIQEFKNHVALRFKDGTFDGQVCYIQRDVLLPERLEALVDAANRWSTLETNVNKI